MAPDVDIEEPLRVVVGAWYIRVADTVDDEIGSGCMDRLSGDGPVPCVALDHGQITGQAREVLFGAMEEVVQHRRRRVQLKQLPHDCGADEASAASNHYP